MFTAENKEKLIYELNEQLKSGTFYTPNCREKINAVDKSKSSSSLYKPFLSTESNPLSKSVYNYSNASFAPVYGIAFEKSNLNSDTLMHKKYSKKSNLSDIKVFSEIQELNMCEIIPDTEESSIINFKAIPKEMALAKINKNANFWTKDIDIIGTIKSILKKSGF